MNKPNILPFAFAAILLCVAPFIRTPYGFFVFLRLMTCGAFIYAIYCSGRNPLKFASGAFVVLYNPLIPIHLTRNIWTVLNIITVIALFCVYIILIKKQKKQVHSELDK